MESLRKSRLFNDYMTHLKKNAVSKKNNLIFF